MTAPLPPLPPRPAPPRVTCRRRSWIGYGREPAGQDTGWCYSTLPSRSIPPGTTRTTRTRQHLRYTTRSDLKPNQPQTVEINIMFRNGHWVGLIYQGAARKVIRLMTRTSGHQLPIRPSDNQWRIPVGKRHQILEYKFQNLERINDLTIKELTRINTE